MGKTLKSEYSAGSSWILYAASLYILALVAQLANLLYLSSNQGQSFSEILIPSLLFLSLLTLPSLWVGFTLGRKLNLGIINQGARAGEGTLFAIASGLLLGAALLGLRWLLLSYLPSELPEYGFRGPIGGLLVSLGAAVGEEVWFRFGLMTLLLYVCTKLIKKKQLPPKIAVIVILLVAFGFGLAHLPQLLSYDAGSTFAIYATILGNVAVGSLYGWCFWRYGLLSAIAAHFSLDVVLHVLPALF